MKIGKNKAKTPRKAPVSLTLSPPERVRSRSVSQQEMEFPQLSQSQEGDDQDTLNQAQHSGFQFSEISTYPSRQPSAESLAEMQSMEEIEPTIEGQLPQARGIPMMQRQWKLSRKPYKSFLSLNCGWYCEKAAIEYVAKQKNINLPRDLLPLKPKSWMRVGYSPGDEGKEFMQQGTKIDNISGWNCFITQVGPVVVSGKLGKADRLGGVRHFILIVGVDEIEKTFKYLDPLEGSTLLSASFDHMLPRIEDKIYWVDVKSLRQVEQTANQEP